MWNIANLLEPAKTQTQQHTTPTKTSIGTITNPPSKLKWDFSATGGRIRTAGGSLPPPIATHV